MRQTTNAQQANVLPIENRSTEVADILREHIAEYQETYPLLPEQYKIVHNLLSCRTAVPSTCPGKDGLKKEKPSCCPFPISTTCSHCPMILTPLYFSIKRSC